MAERLKLQLGRDSFADRDNLRQAQLPRQNDPLRAKVEPALRADVVCNRLLRRNVPLAVRGVLPGHRKRAEVRENQRVRTRRIQLLERGRLVVSRHGIHRHMHAYSVFVGKLDSLRQLFGRKVSRKRAHTKARSRQIHCVRAV